MHMDRRKLGDREEEKSNNTQTNRKQSTLLNSYPSDYLQMLALHDERKMICTQLKSEIKKVVIA